MCFRNGATLRVARRDVPLRNGIIFLSALISAAGALLLSGCSGGHSSGSTGSLPTPTPTPTPITLAPVTVTAQIVWPARSRAVAAPSTIGGTASALSATITLTGTGTIGNVTVIANRPTGSDTASATSTYTLSGTAVPNNLYSLKVNFYAASNAGGSVVATASQANTLVQTDGTLKATVIATATNVATVTIRDIAAVGSTTGLSGVVMVGQTADVLYSLYDSGGNLLAAPPAVYGSGFVTVSDSTKLSTPSGAGDEITGVAPTLATTFTVSVDGVASNPFTTEVLSTEKVAVSPDPGTVSPGIAQVFTATATTLPATDKAFGVTWTFGLKSAPTAALTSGGANGTFTSTATTFTYTPPATIPPVVGPYVLVATSNYDPNVSVSVPVTVASLVAVTISPNPATTLSLKQTEAFTATVTDDPTAAGVTWTATGGTFSTTTTTSGTATTYTAPAATGTYTVTATSIFDPSKSASVNVTVNSLVAVSISPNTPNPIPLSVDQTDQFTATVAADPTSAGVTWSIQDSSGNTLTSGGVGGSITTTGLYTAPASVATASGTKFFVVATSVLDPTKLAKVAVSVGSANVPVTVN